MKILLINNFHYRLGGSETVYFNTADLLREHGHEVLFFSQTRKMNIACDQEDFFSEAIDFNSHGLVKKLKGVIQYFYNFNAARSLEKLILKEKPDVAHIHLLWGGLGGAILKELKKYNVPIVYSVHEYRMVCPAYTFKDGNNKVCELCGSGAYWHCLQKKCCKGDYLLSMIMALEMYFRNTFLHPAKYVDTFIFVSKFCKNIHLKFDKRFENTQSAVLYNFCNSDVLKYKNGMLDTYHNYFLFYGRLSFEKGIVTLIKAFSSFPHLNLKIVGKGPQEEMLKELCEKERITNVDFLGFKSGKELYDLVEKAKFVCVPSEWYENNPMTIVEAYSLNTPVLGADIGGISEIIIDGVTGFLHRSGSVNDISRKLSLISSLSELDYQRLKNSAFSFARDNFDRERYYEQLVNIYLKVVR